MKKTLLEFKLENPDHVQLLKKLKSLFKNLKKLSWKKTQLKILKGVKFSKNSISEKFFKILKKCTKVKELMILSTSQSRPNSCSLSWHNSKKMVIES
jgi:hypothetical protein